MHSDVEARRPEPKVQRCTDPKLQRRAVEERRAEQPPVLVVADPACVPRALCEAIRRSGRAVTVCVDLTSALEAALADPPACIVCDAELPDGDAFVLARWLRAHDAEPLASTALVMLTGPLDLEARLHGYRAGADVCISRALPAREAAAQVEALLRFAVRERSAIEGSLAAMELATLLSVLELEGKTGIFEVESEGCAAEIELRRGEAVAARLLGAPAPPLEALRAMLGWQTGRFAFRALPTIRSSRQSWEPTPMRALLAEAAKLQDEATAA